MKDLKAYTKKTYTIGLDPYEEDEGWELSLAGSAENCIWNTAFEEKNLYKDYWEMDESWTSKAHRVNDYYWNMYPAVAVGDVVELKGTSVMSIVGAIGNNGMGELTYRIRFNNEDKWVTRAQLTKVL